MSEQITSENILDKLRRLTPEQTPAVCLVAGNEIASLRADVERLRPYYDALRQRHNGYDSEARKQMDTLKEPESPYVALDELIDEAEEMGSGTNQCLVDLVTESRAQLLALLEEARDEISKWMTFAQKEFGGAFGMEDSVRVRDKIADALAEEKSNATDRTSTT